VQLKTQQMLLLVDLSQPMAAAYHCLTGSPSDMGDYEDLQMPKSGGRDL
jgi:hypothetical protein